MGRREVIYRSNEDKTDEQAHAYVQTHQAAHRYLAYRDIPLLLQQFAHGKRALDYGAGTGASSVFLSDLGFDVIGVDVSSGMLEKAQTNFPDIQFCSVENLTAANDFDVVFSSFVLFELDKKDNIVQYLNKSSSFLKENGIASINVFTFYACYRNISSINRKGDA